MPGPLWPNGALFELMAGKLIAVSVEPSLQTSVIEEENLKIQKIN
jgi:hypothetical protein